MRCPVEGKWRPAGNVGKSDLTPEQLENARQDS
jgi:hypothetical protein